MTNLKKKKEKRKRKDKPILAYAIYSKNDAHNIL